MQPSRRILVTTSRNPTPRIRAFSNELGRMIFNAVRVNRGKMSVDEIAEKAVELQAENVIVVDRWQGGPGEIRMFTVAESGLIPVDPVIHVGGIRLQREFVNVARAKPAVSVSTAQPESGEVRRLAEAFSSFLSIPILSIKDASDAGQCSIRVMSSRDGRVAVTFMAEPEHVEVGPSIRISALEWKVSK